MTRGLPAAPWARLSVLSPVELAEPSLQLLWAAQLVASAGQTFAEPSPDDSHRAMTWSGSHSALVGSAFAGPYPFRVALRPTDLTLLLLDRTDQTLGAFPLRGHTRAEGYDWLAVAMATYLGGSPPHIERPEYDLPPHPVGGKERFDVDDRALSVLEALYGSAAALLADVAESHPGASEVRCWPHHFDMATLISLESRSPDGEAQTIGAGLAPMGGGYESWYWYVTPWPYPDPGVLPPLPDAGSWHTEGWVGAVLTGESVTAAPPERRRDLVRSFLEAAIQAAETALLRSRTP